VSVGANATPPPFQQAAGAYNRLRLGDISLMQNERVSQLSPSARRLEEALAARGIELAIREFPEGTRTAAEAAAAVGCDVAQICKSLVFRRASGEPLLVIASGPNRVDEAKVGALTGEPVAMADPAYVRQTTGFAIGGVPPAGHAREIETIVDADLLALDEVWAAAGNPRAVFPLAPQQLVELTGGRVADVAQSR
jgi:prolyl-tRNA editing enzyme YbaK/EbsC (Cys-tRNA(Pro) deacylase)